MIDPSGSGSSDARAWLLTAGHCISLDAYGVILNQPLAAQVTFNYFVDTPDKQVVVRTRSTGWSTMKGVDLALIELDATLGSLRAQGIHPLPIAQSSPMKGSPVYFAGIPMTPIPAEQQFLRRGSCTLGERVQVVESAWIWPDETSNNCPDLYGGASGSPLFDAETNEIIGVIGTTTVMNFEEGPDYDCQTNRPCVMKMGGPVMEKNAGYASPAPNIKACFDATNTFDVRRSGCPLDPGYQLAVNSGAREVQPVVNGIPASWDARLSGSQRYYSYKRFAAGEGACADPAGYGTPIETVSAPVIRDPIGSADGYYFLCVIAGDSPAVDSTWQKPAHASVRFKRLDSQPPVVAIDYNLVAVPGGYQLLNTTGGEAPSGLGPAFYKLGPPAATVCNDPDGYRVQLSIPVTIRTSEFPIRMCLKVSDLAGNSAVPSVFDFGPSAVFPSAVQNGASLARGVVSPGGLFRADTFNLTPTTEYSSTPVPTLAGVRAAVRDPAGRMHPLLLTTAGPLFIEGLLPDSVAAGDAVLSLQPPQGPELSQEVKIRQGAPGLFQDPGGAPVGFATDHRDVTSPFSVCTDSGSCNIVRLPVSSTPGGLKLVVYGTGFRNAGSVKVRVGTHTITEYALVRHPDLAGVDELHFRLPQDFPLRLFQTISLETTEGDSNYAWIYLN